MNFQPAASLTEQIADHLSDEIVTGTLPPGSRIQELKVAKQLGVSRGSVREALITLEGRHLIEIAPRRGAVVVNPDAAYVGGLFDALTELLAVTFQKVALCGRPEPVLESLHDIDLLRTGGSDRSLLDIADGFVAAANASGGQPIIGTLVDNLRAPARWTLQRGLEKAPSARDELADLIKSVAHATKSKDCQQVGEAVRVWMRRAHEVALGAAARAA